MQQHASQCFCIRGAITIMSNLSNSLKNFHYYIKFNENLSTSSMELQGFVYILAINNETHSYRNLLQITENPAWKSTHESTSCYLVIHRKINECLFAYLQTHFSCVIAMFIFYYFSHTAML